MESSNRFDIVGVIISSFCKIIVLFSENTSLKALIFASPFVMRATVSYFSLYSTARSFGDFNGCIFYLIMTNLLINLFNVMVVILLVSGFGLTETVTSILKPIIENDKESFVNGITEMSFEEISDYNLIEG